MPIPIPGFETRQTREPVDIAGDAVVTITGWTTDGVPVKIETRVRLQPGDVAAVVHTDEPPIVLNPSRVDIPRERFYLEVGGEMLPRERGQSFYRITQTSSPDYPSQWSDPRDWS